MVSKRFILLAFAFATVLFLSSTITTAREFTSVDEGEIEDAKYDVDAKKPIHGPRWRYRGPGGYYGGGPHGYYHHGPDGYYHAGPRGYYHRGPDGYYHGGPRGYYHGGRDGYYHGGPDGYYHDGPGGYDKGWRYARDDQASAYKQDQDSQTNN